MEPEFWELDVRRILSGGGEPFQAPPAIGRIAGETASKLPDCSCNGAVPAHPEHRMPLEPFG